MRVVSGVIKGVPTVFVGLNTKDMRTMMNRTPIMIPVATQLPEPGVDFQLLLVGGETDESLDEQIVQLGHTIFDPDERTKN